MKESTRKHYHDEILRVLRKEGAMHLGNLHYLVKTPPTSNANYADVDTVREVRREMETNGLLHVWKDKSQRNNPLMIELALDGPRQIRGVRIVLDAVGLAADSISTELRCQPTDVRQLPALIAAAVRDLIAEHSVALNVRPTQRKAPIS